MPEYLAPGVYIQEMPSANKAIQGASTSTAGMVGLTERGPVGVPTLVTSLGQFKRIFGGTLDPTIYNEGKDALPHAVSGFYANSGSRVYVVRVTGTGATAAKKVLAADTLSIYARSQGGWGNAVQATISHTSRFNAQILARTATTQLKLASTFGLSVGTTIAIGTKEYVVDALLADNVIVLNKVIDVADVVDGAAFDVLVATLATAQAALDAAIAADAAGDHSALITARDAAQVALDAATPKAFAKSVEFDLLVERMAGGVAFETELFTGLSLNAASPSYAPRILGSCDVSGANPTDTGDSQMVRIFVPATPKSRPASGLFELAGGSDGMVTDATYTGTPSDDPSERTGIEALNNEPGISLVAVPGQTSETVQKALLAHCEKQVYRFAILDAPQGAKIKEVQDHRGRFDSTRAALYYPWLTIAAPFGPKGTLHAIPPSGHMIGLYARTDNKRGVWKAPANESVRNILGFDIPINKGEQDILNPKNINCLRNFPEQGGPKCWGARTLSTDPAWRYIPVRRTFLFIEQSLDAGLQWSVFEPNAKPLWDTVRQSITGFLDSIWRQGGLAGATRDEAFFVNVGYGETMEQDDLANGRLIVQVGIAPVYPAEFVIIQISQKTLEAAG